ncbi:MAG TPA: vWA domain-containing protein [Kofleriaceae bacterium]|nr:vWA domain-containing protein [Kofleriaceae bacterium]
MKSIAAALPLSLLLATGCVGSVGGEDPLDPGGDDGDGDGSGGGGDDGDCASVEVALTESTPTVMLLVDRSGSMYDPFGGTDRWTAVYETLVNEATGVVKRLEQQVRFGVAFYTSTDADAENGTCPVIDQVMPAMGNYGSIHAMFDALEPIEDTPTAPSLTVARSLLETVTENGPKIIVLATDGLPDTCEVPDPGSEAQQLALQDETVAAAMDVHAAGIDVYYVSVGPEVTAQHAQAMANAGRGLPVGGAENAPYYQALNSDALVAAFDDIIADVRSCTFAVDGSVDLSRASEGIVTLDGTELTFGTDWDMVDESTIELLGGACDSVKDGADHQISAQFTCGSVVD